MTVASGEREPSGRRGCSGARRLFVAIDVPRPDRMGGVLDDLRRWGLRVPPTDRLHLTLLFLGAVDPAAVSGVERAVAAVAARHRPLDLALTGATGRFGRTVLWAELAPAPRLVDLAADLRREVRAAGAEVEKRAFHPHVTLARAGRGRVNGAAATAVTVPAVAWRADEIRLVDSAVGSRPATWTTLGRFRLGTAVPDA